MSQPPSNGSEPGAALAAEESGASPLLPLNADQKITLVLHSVDTVWKSWQYQLDRGKEFHVLLTAIAGGTLALAVSQHPDPTLQLGGACLGGALSAYWARLNRRWSMIITNQTTSLHDLARAFGLQDQHCYLSKRNSILSHIRQSNRHWWVFGSMSIALVYLAFFIFLFAYFFPWRRAIALLFPS
jgi:hypothetical protein